ncbi:DUF2332 domain-containing protein [Bacillus sp. SCS-153A]|uniref:DUF2332 domain-containing protein n=1 Tax=Rossellomorea sedimentorum TaxID=3115294 RepID=UPI003905CBCF
MVNTILSETFNRFAERECRGSSDLYEHLSRRISEDEEILELCGHAREGQPVPNLLLGSVHYLLLKGYQHSLKDYYPSLTRRPKTHEAAFMPFKEFCREYKKEILHLLETKLVQTNEVRRCAYLFPAFTYVYEIMNKPLALIEIGTSAGLQLMWDHYSYSYGTGKVYGNVNSTVELQAKIIGEHGPVLKEEIPPVSHRIGMDLHINNIADKEDYLWLSALIWPEHEERRQVFEQAAEYVKASDINLIEGDGIELLPRTADEIPEEFVVCVFHTHVANQIPVEGKKKLFEEIQRIAAKRDVIHIYNNMNDRELHLDYFKNGTEYKNIIGQTEGHGRWFEWQL